MSRGRRAKSPEVKAALGNPGKRRQALERAKGDKPADNATAKPRALSAKAPEYLTQESEKEIFRQIIRAMPANLARKSDVHAIARWATWLAIWIDAKKRLDGYAHWYESKSKHGTFLREHPISKRMHQAETHLVTLEDRLGLNIVARHNIINKLFNMPPAAPGEGLFADEPIDDKTAPKPMKSDPKDQPLSPLAFLQQADTRHAKPN
jgi:phage terminase small subunit